MASIFKRGRDKDKRHAFWYISYNDHLGKRRTKKGYTDKGLTEQLAAKIEREVTLRRRGLIDPEDERRLKIKSSPIRPKREPPTSTPLVGTPTLPSFFAAEPPWSR